MRIRQVKPSFWSDKVTARLPKSARLTYIGLWGLADDAGWIEWAPDAIAASIGATRRCVLRDGQQLEKAGLLAVGACGHAVLPRAGRVCDIRPDPTSHDCASWIHRHQPERAAEDRLFRRFATEPHWLLERQVRLGPGAIADLILGLTDEAGERYILIIEVKAVPAGAAAAAQARRYLAAAEERWSEPLQAVVIAPSLTRSFPLDGSVLGVRLDA